MNSSICSNQCRDGRVARKLEEHQQIHELWGTNSQRRSQHSVIWGTGRISMFEITFSLTAGSYLRMYVFGSICMHLHKSSVNGGSAKPNSILLPLLVTTY